MCAVGDNKWNVICMSQLTFLLLAISQQKWTAQNTMHPIRTKLCHKYEMIVFENVKIMIGKLSRQFGKTENRFIKAHNLLVNQK